MLFVESIFKICSLVFWSGVLMSIDKDEKFRRKANRKLKRSGIMSSRKNYRIDFFKLGMEVLGVFIAILIVPFLKQLFSIKEGIQDTVFQLILYVIVVIIVDLLVAHFRKSSSK